jgi:hypothetical protein
VILAECTVEPPGEDKIAALAGRSNGLRAHLASESRSPQIFTCLFVCKPADALEKQSRDALAHGVRIICSEDIVKILALLRNDCGVDELVNCLRSSQHMTTWGRLRPGGFGIGFAK